MLNEKDSLDQFLITVRQLELCRELVLGRTEAQCRAALILLDNVSDVIFYRITREEFSKDDFTRKVVPERYPPSRRSDINWKYKAKLDVVAATHRLSTSVCTSLNILHRYRNSAYHREVHNPSILPILSRLALVAVANLFANTSAGVQSHSFGSDRKTTLLPSRYGLPTSFVVFEEAARIIAKQLKVKIKPRLDSVVRAFERDLTGRVREVRIVLDDVFPSCPVERIDALLKFCEFRRKNSDLESKLSTRVRSLNYMIAEGRGDEISRDEYVTAETQFRAAYDEEFRKFQPSCRYGGLDKIEQGASLFRKEKDFCAALARYADLDARLTAFEESTLNAYHEIEWAGEMQYEIEHGK